MNKKLPLLSFLLSVFILSACATGGTTATAPVASSMNPRLKTSAIDKAMESALAQAEASGNAQEILAMLGQVHRRAPKDPIVATRYARALRDDEQINAAVRTLKPFTKGSAPNVEAVTEMSMTQLSLGDFSAAESYAEQAINMNPKNARAYLALGTAQDAQERHQEAEVSFRNGVKHWQGDASPILNNLALNLASQGHLEESLSLLKKAQKLAPHRIELERNRRIIATLLESTGSRPPAPNAKPKETTEKKTDQVAPKPKPKKGNVAQKNIAAKNTKEVKKETIKQVEKKIEEAVSEKKMDVKIQGVVKMKSNIKLKPLN